MYCKQCHELPWSEKEIACNRWCCLIFGWNSSFASFNIQRPERYRCSLFRFFADRTNGTRLRCVHSLSNSVCRGPVCSSSMMFSLFSLARAAWRGALAVSDMSHKNYERMESSWDLCPMILRIQKRKRRCRRRLLKSAKLFYEFISSLGGLKFRGFLALASRRTGSCHCRTTDVSW